MDLTSKYADYFKNVTIGFEFEHYCNLPKKQYITQLEKALDKKIEFIEQYHSPFKPDDKTFKVELDYSGGLSLLEMITGPLDYKEARVVFIKMCKFLQEKCYTTDKCSVHINIGFKSKTNPKTGVTSESELSKINILKFCLDFQENLIYDKFPNRENSVYAKSIKKLYPVDKFVFEPGKTELHSKNFALPNRKYYGVNFTKLVKNYLEFRYIGGAKYEYKVDDILELSDMFIISLAKVLENPELTDINKLNLYKSLDFYNIVIDASQNLDSLKKNFKGLEFTVDLKDDKTYIETFYPKLSDKIYNILIDSGLKKGKLNYDSNTSKFQIKDATLKRCYFIGRVDLLNCTISGIIDMCDIYKCKLIDSEIRWSNLHECTVIESKIENSFTGRECECNDCYVAGKAGMFNGTMNRGVFREGTIMKNAKISKETSLIEYQKVVK